MKPTGRSDFTFDSGLVVCLTDDIEDCELLVSFEESLSLQLVAEGVLFLASQIENKHSTEDLLNFLIVFFNIIEQYSLAPTSTAKSSTHQPLDSMIVFKAKYLLILVPCQDSIFSSQGHVSSMRRTFLKPFEKILMSGLS